ncbi:hypothetical protein tloyanaT_03990 [Thalassotalea loyana]|uniref:Uncharacterized protein n=1 Tax=Thalassotalea loyana TaxID=280483 RepID=A0ABQ6H7N8_9GAMM|nr:hypothetical protein [Thalassotalea loyana]GLX84147.1 hypothetical protein tloyanaT_03990 [Thalassotalea loyana]
MEVLYIFFNQSKVVSDTLTILVGLVAIGIPLAIQVAVQSSEKYNNRVLTKRLTTGIVNPVTLISLSSLYVLSSLIFKSSLAENSTLTILTKSELIISITLQITFVLLVLGATWFYIRLYLKVLETPSKYLPNLLIPKTSLLARKVSKEQLRRYDKRDLANLEAGLEVLLEQFNSNSWDENYTDLLHTLHRHVINTYFGDYQEEYLSLDKAEIKVVLTYWRGLIRVVKVSRNVSDSPLSFRSQRLLADLCSEIVHHPQYNEITSKGAYSSSSGSLIDWYSDIYELARWQSHHDRQGIDLILECEWFSNVFKGLVRLHFKHSAAGTLDTFNLLYSIAQLVAHKHPEKLVKLYTNVSDAFIDDYEDNYIRRNYDKDISWLYDYWRDFNDIPLSLSSTDALYRKIDSLKNGSAFIEYGIWRESRPLTQEEIDSELEAVNFKKLFKKAFSNHYNYLSIKMGALMAYHERWNEMICCFEWEQPKGTQVHYVGRALFLRNEQEVIELFASKLHHITDMSLFIERESIQPYAIRFLLIQLAYCLNRKGNLSSLSVSNNYVEVSRLKELFSYLSVELRQISNTVEVVKNNATELKLYIEESIALVEEMRQKVIDNLDVSIERWKIFKNDLISGWNEASRSRALLMVIPTIYSKKVKRNEFKVKIENKPVFELSEYQTHYDVKTYGTSFNNYFVNKLFELLKESAQANVKTVIGNGRLLILASKETLNKLGFKKQQDSYEYIHSSYIECVGLEVISDNIIQVDLENVQLELTSNASYFDEYVPIFPSYIVEKGLVKADLSVFYELTFSSPDSISLLQLP